MLDLVWSWFGLVQVFQVQLSVSFPLYLRVITSLPLGSLPPVDFHVSLFSHLIGNSNYLNA